MYQRGRHTGSINCVSSCYDGHGSNRGIAGHDIVFVQDSRLDCGRLLRYRNSSLTRRLRAIILFILLFLQISENLVHISLQYFNFLGLFG